MFDTQRFPYMSILYNKKTEKFFYGIIQNISKTYTSFIDINSLRLNGDLNKVINLADIWWKTSNNIPLCVFYRERFDAFNYAKKHLLTNDALITCGWEGIHLKTLSEKRIKRKLISI